MALDSTIFDTAQTSKLLVNRGYDAGDTTNTEITTSDTVCPGLTLTLNGVEEGDSIEVTAVASWDVENGDGSGGSFSTMWIERSVDGGAWTEVSVRGYATMNTQGSRTTCIQFFDSNVSAAEEGNHQYRLVGKRNEGGGDQRWRGDHSSLQGLVYRF